MTVVLSKKISLQSAQVFLKIERKTERKDIQEYLNGKTFSNKLIEDRIKKYLQEVKIYNEQNHLTPAGNELKQTGLMDILEEGSYQIWFTANDPFFGNKIMFIKRVKAGKQRAERAEKEDFEEIQLENNGHFCLPTTKDKDDHFKFNLKIFNGRGVLQQKQNAVLSYRWKWKDLESSVDTFSGQITVDISREKNKDNICHIDAKMQFVNNSDLSEKIKEVLPNWNSETKRCKIQFDKLNDDDCTSFECVYESKWKDFDVNIEGLPIEPYDGTEARIWRNHLLEKELQKNYINPKDFPTITASLNDKKAFEIYKGNLDVPTAENYRQEINPSKVSDRGYEYWHITAPFDLNPAIPKEMITGSFHYSVGTIVSFCDIAASIHAKPVDKLFYYDKYVITERQQKSLCAFFSAFSFNGAYLITNTADKNRSDYIEKRYNQFFCQIVQKNLNDIFKDSASQHDRYLILAAGGELKIWTISNSLDYLEFSDVAVSADTKGKINQSVTFNNVKPTMLFPQLLQFIEGEVKNA